MKVLQSPKNRPARMKMEETSHCELEVFSLPLNWAEVAVAGAAITVPEGAVAVARGADVKDTVLMGSEAEATLENV